MTESNHQGANPPPLTEGHPLADQESLDPLLQLMGEGMAPVPDDTDMNRLVAAVDVIGRCGAKDFETGFDDEQEAPLWWYARCIVRDARGLDVVQLIEHRADPVDASERLARRLINGGTCTHCGRVISLRGALGDQRPTGQPGVCFWTREAKRWERGCGELIEEGVRQEAVIESFLKAGRRPEGGA